MIVEIVEDHCIGCTKCLDVCPTDAIIGASKQIHGVDSQYCIGCLLCIPPCPTQCFNIIEQDLSTEQRQARAQMAKQRVQRRQLRLKRQAERKIASDQMVINSNLKQSIADILARQKSKSLLKHESETN